MHFKPVFCRAGICCSDGREGMAGRVPVVTTTPCCRRNTPCFDHRRPPVAGNASQPRVRPSAIRATGRAGHPAGATPAPSGQPGAQLHHHFGDGVGIVNRIKAAPVGTTPSDIVEPPTPSVATTVCTCAVSVDD